MRSKGEKVRTHETLLTVVFVLNPEPCLRRTPALDDRRRMMPMRWIKSMIEMWIWFGETQFVLNPLGFPTREVQLACWNQLGQYR
jgi:hypothetical protein